MELLLINTKVKNQSSELNEFSYSNKKKGEDHGLPLLIVSLFDYSPVASSVLVSTGAASEVPASEVPAS
jgi:hypothetical protein